MKFEKAVTINLGNFESLKIGVSDCDSFQQCDTLLDNELDRLVLNSKGVKPQ